jgi:branched-chain amino acid transport system permease protein
MKLGLKLALAALVVGLLATVPWWGSPVMVQFGINALILATLAQSWNIIGGYTGYPSFGNSVFYGLGGYGVAIAMVQFQLPFAVGLMLGIFLAVLFAFLLGLPVLRLRGHYFAIATLGLAEVMTAIVSNLEIAGRNVGLILPLLKGDTVFLNYPWLCWWSRRLLSLGSRAAALGSASSRSGKTKKLPRLWA